MRAMSCQTVRNSMSEFLDRRVTGEEHTRVVRHLARCRECATHLDKLTQMRRSLQGLPTAPVPNRLRTQLLVLASRERARWNATKTFPLAVRNWVQNVRFSMDNLMRPLALPFAGGVLSALLLFGMLVPTLGFHHNVRNDVPTSLYTAATQIGRAHV